MLAELSSRIRRRETPFYDWLYRTAKSARAANVPPFRPIYGPLRREREARLAAWSRLTRLLYCEPIFRTYCDECGPGLRVLGGIPQVNSHLTLKLGEHVTLHGTTSLMGGKIAERPTLAVGDYSHLGYQFYAAVGDRIDIGRHVLVASRVSLMGYDFHPVDAIKRARGEPPEEGGTESITLGDYTWLGAGVIVLKGVTVGEGAVIGAGSVVTQNIPPYTLAAGQPARVLRSLGSE